MKRKYSLIIGLLMILTLCNTGCISAVNQNLIPNEQIQDLEKAVVADVIDGDTIELSDRRHVRLIGLDTPELNLPDGPIEYYGLQAKEFTKQKLLGETVYLEYDEQKFDEYDRTLAYVYLADGTLFNTSLLQQGYAHLLTITPNTRYVELFKEQVITARRNNQGLWRERNTGLPVISWQEAEQYIGEEVVVTGEIVDSYNSGEVVFLNFAHNYEQSLSAVIFASDEYKFAVEAEDYFLNQQVRIRGEIKEHQGAPEIVIEDPTQII